MLSDKTMAYGEDVRPSALRVIRQGAKEPEVAEGLGTIFTDTAQAGVCDLPSYR